MALAGPLPPLLCRRASKPSSPKRKLSSCPSKRESTVCPNLMAVAVAGCRTTGSGLRMEMKAIQADNQSKHMLTTTRKIMHADSNKMIRSHRPQTGVMPTE